MDKDVFIEIKQIEKEIESDKIKTDLIKKKFINDIRNGLGEEIKTNPNKVTIIKIPLYKRIINRIGEFFNRISKVI